MSERVPVVPFDFLRVVATETIARCLPQLGAEKAKWVLLVGVEAERAAQVMAALPPDFRFEVAAMIEEPRLPLPTVGEQRELENEVAAILGCR